MYKRTFWGFAFLTLIVGFSVWLVSKIPLQLGIDLQGGTELRYYLDLGRIEGDRARIAEEVKDIITKRLNAYGLKEINIAVQGQDELVIQLPGTDVQSVSDLKNQIESTGSLTFRLVASEPATTERIRELKTEEAEYLAADRDWVTRRRADPTFAEKRPQPPRLLARSEVEKEKTADGKANYRPVRDQILENQHVYDEEAQKWVPEGIVSGEYLTKVLPSWDRDTVRPAVHFEFSGEGAMEFGDLTRANVGRPLAIVLDDDVMQVATIKSQITSSGQLSGNFDDDDVKGIVTILRGGSLKTKPVLISESTVGSILGQDSIRSGMQAIFIGLTGVMAIMAIYYLVGGLVADFSLCLNLLLILAFVACFRQTLTLPGLAGMLLTLAMAVDANILIFERYREERKKGKPFSQALGAAYNRAFSVIFDSNVTTLITGYVLFYMGTGPVKGFAVTLITGIFASFFTAVFVTRLILSGLGRLGVIKDIKMLQAFETPRVPFTRYQRPFILGSAVLIAATWILVIWRGMENYGIEFTSGVRVTMNLSKPVKVDDLRDKMGDVARAHPDLFRDWTLQTLRAEAGSAGVSSRYALLTRPGTAGKAAAEEPPAGEAAKEAVKAPETPKDTPKTPEAPEAAKEAAKAQETAPPPEGKSEQGGVGAPPAGVSTATLEPRAAPQTDVAQEIRRVLEGMLEREGWLVPPAFPKVQWTPAAGGSPGSERLELEVNVLAEKEKEPITADELKRQLNASLEANPLFTTAGRDPGAAYKGVQVESVDVLETGAGADASPVKRYSIKTTAFTPRLQSERTELGVPAREQVMDQVRKFFADMGKTNQLQLSEPFSEVATVGSRVASGLQADALVAIFISIVGIVFYMSLRFEFNYGLAGIVALIHDVMVAIGITALTDQFLSSSYPVKINLNELAAILTIIGFSINDTIVLFDRIRENAELHAKRKISLEENMDLSINQTLSRTIWTSVTVLLVTVVLLGFGGESIRGFAFVFAVGTVAGVYSTVFIACPVALWLHKRAAARRERDEALASGPSGGRRG